MPSVPAPAPPHDVAPSPASSPPVAESRGPGTAWRVARDDDAYLEQGRRALASLVPKTAAQARIQIAPVLRSAADAHHPSYDRTVVALASAPGTLDAAFVDQAAAPREARRLHDDARRAYWSRRDVREVLDLELKAFGANPNDAEIVGHLAFLHLHTRPMQADRARLLALHALGLRSPAFPAGRPDDWITFAVASALTSRPIDATQGLYAAVAVASDPEHVCQAALAALEAHGERLREPVDALLARLQSQGRIDGSRACVRRPQRLVEWRSQ
jgi:hypothetical protein